MQMKARHLKAALEAAQVAHKDAKKSWRRIDAWEDGLPGKLAAVPADVDSVAELESWVRWHGAELKSAFEPIDWRKCNVPASVIALVEWVAPD